MSTEKSTKKISQLTAAENISNDDVFIVSSPSETTTDNGYVSKKMPFQKIFDRIKTYIDSITSNFVKKTQSTNNSSVSICGGTSEETGAQIVLTGKDDTNGHGFLYLNAKDDENKARLSLKPNGELYLYNKDNTKTHIVRSVNGLSADKSGNVNIASANITNLKDELNKKADKDGIILSVENNTATLKVDGQNKGTISIPEIPEIPTIPNNVESANKWKTARTITLSNDATGSVDIDGSSNVTLNVSVVDNSHNHIIANIDGLQDELNKKANKTDAGGIANIGIGSVIAFAGENIPDNTLLCDGSEISKDIYQALWLVIRDKYGQASDSSKFKLPNLNQRFIEGGTTVGTYKEPGLPDITGYFSTTDIGGDGPPQGAFAWHETDKMGIYAVSGSSTKGRKTLFNASKSNPNNPIYGKSETVQPPAVLMKYVIVYKQLGGGNVIINTEGGSGGVIDGTVLRGPMVVKSTQSNTPKDIYTVENDCLLYFYSKRSANLDGNDPTFYINGNPVAKMLDSGSNVSEGGILDAHILVKAGSVISQSGYGLTITFYEYKLNSLTPQVAFPDWDNNKAVTITLDTNNKGTILNNGWIVVSTPDKLGSGYLEVYINDILVQRFINQGGNTKGYTVSIPVTKNDVVTIQSDRYSETAVKFYPVKSVSFES